MSRPILEVADVFRRHGDAYRLAHAIDRSAARVMGAITACRTAALGGHVERCDAAACGFTRISYNSCRNRHCTKCQSNAAREWLAEHAADLLPVEYFHVVFTLPPAVAAIAKQNKAVVYGLLFEAAAETLKTIAADPRHLGAEIGMTMVLHTWGQTLTYHPHVHVIVPGGGLSPDGNTWIACRPGFFLPVKVLQRLYRRLFLAKLAAAHANGRLQFFGALASLADARAFARHLEPVRRSDWIVYAKKPFAGPEQMLRYLARYTHRIAISNRRITGLDDRSVTFTWKDYRDGREQKVMTLDAHEFIRRFLLHVLPDGFQRIRHYGFLANGHRKAKLATIRKLLDTAPPEPAVSKTPPGEPTAATPDATPPCPCCGGPMRIIEVLADPRRRAHGKNLRFDSS
jgi:Putative transposase/Transposase zinc-binding domain